LKNDNNTFDNNVTVSRLTAIWAFSESAFGGILHAISVPFRGIFINAAAVILITLIAVKSASRQILKSTLIVVVIKALVSPHSPLTAHFAVSMQGIIGSLLFRTKRFFRLSALLLGIITLILSGTQKIIILTVLFGNSFWKSIDVFIKQVSKDFLKLGLPSDYHYGFILIGLYISIHLIAGIIVGYYAGLLPAKLSDISKSFENLNLERSETEIIRKDKKGKKKSWIQRPSGIIILSVLFVIMIYSYFYPYKLEIKSIEILIMILRAVLLTILWYFVLAPLIRKLFLKHMSGKKNLYSQEVDEIVNLFPKFREIVSYCWSESKKVKGLRRIKIFLSTSFYNLLFSK
jgi:hypothetical protein